MNKLVSIVVPVYNVKLYLDRCLDSLINQTYNNIEIIVVDDGSTDGSGTFIDDYAQKDNRIKAIHQENGGLSAARNTGMKYVKGEYIVFVDSDDYIKETMIEKMLHAMTKEKLDVVCCNRKLFWDSGKERVQYAKNENSTNIMIFNSKEAIVEMNRYHYFDMSAHSKMYKKELFNNMSFPQGKLSEDMYIMYLIFDKATRVGYISEPLLFYYQRNGSISKTKKINFDFIEAAEQQYKYISKKYPDLDIFMKCVCMVANLTVYDIVVNNGGKCTKEELKGFKTRIKKDYNAKTIRALGWKRKLQLQLFMHCTIIYDALIKIYKKV